MNILVLGSDTVEKNLVGLCRKSKFLDHIYTASSEPLQDTPNVEYVDYIDLIYIIKALQIDLVLLAD